MSFVAQAIRDRSAAAAGHYPPPPFPPPFTPPGPTPAPDVQVHPPLVYMAPVWEYRHAAYPVADAGAASTLAALEALGREGWELAGVIGDGQLVHYYFKRER